MAEPPRTRYPKPVGALYRNGPPQISEIRTLIALPLLTAASALLFGGHELQPSLSDYYFVVIDGGLPRTIFLIFLAFLGCVLFAYRGLDEKDNLIHNAAGIFSFGVALFPMRCDLTEHQYCVPGLLPLLHLPSAGLLYLSAVISVMYGGGPKLREALSRLPDSKTWFSRLGRIKYLSTALRSANGRAEDRFMAVRSRRRTSARGRWQSSTQTRSPRPTAIRRRAYANPHKNP